MAKKKVRAVVVREKERAKKKMKRRARAIVVGHLEKISSGVFEDYPEQITGLTEGTQGVYALYRRKKLYYIGLASDLKRRIKWHLKDKHKGKWDQFSLYIIRKTDHIREVESVVVRIAEPRGNKQRGRLRGSKNLVWELDEAIKERQEAERIKILGGGKGRGREKKVRKRRKKGKTEERTLRKRLAKRRRKRKMVKRPLRGVFPRGKVIYASYKGKDYKAWVRTNGGIRFNGQTYDSPSGAAKAILDRGAVNGWRFWKYKDKDGNLVMLRDLRRQRGKPLKQNYEE
jgi:hypothetical protein